MTLYRSEFLNTLSERGFIHQCSDSAGLDSLAQRGEIIAYIGFDCTARSLHVGSLVQIMLLHWAQKLGQKPIVLMGGGTTQVGDPSGRDETRKILSLAEIETNKENILRTFSGFLQFDGASKPAQSVDNAAWLMQLNYIEMLRTIGRHFSINRMLTMDSVRLRLERSHELSFIEFNYMVLQAYDFVELARQYGCNLQMGGSDQWGNIVTGIDLGRRMGTHQLFALTTPLITLASGAKMGKSAAGAVWLDQSLLSAYDYWQFWRNCEDADVGRFLRLFTCLPLAEIARLEVLKGAEINEAKKILAHEATSLLHGKDNAMRSLETSHKTFEQGQIADGLPTIMLDIAAGVGLLHALVAAGLASSNGEARRAIQGGALRINDEKIADERLILSPTFMKDGVIKLSMGRKKHVLLKQL